MKDRNDSAPIKLIIHADDFGLTESVNDGIIDAHKRGVVTATSIMANGKAFDHAVSLSRSVPDLDLGIHLTLVEEEPVSSPDSIPSLVMKSGKFYGHAMAFAKQYFLRRICLDDVEREFEAQIQKVFDAGLKINHMDSHQHMHMLPDILRITVKLSKKYKIPVIRLPHERFEVYMLGRRTMFSRLMPMIVLSFFCYLGKRCIDVHTDSFSGYFFGGDLNKTNLKKIIHALPSSGTCELVCHPGLSRKNRGYDHWNYHWADEWEALTDPDLITHINNRAIRLIAYRDIIEDNMKYANV